MNAFIKIGLPWAFSIGTVFYLGLYFGSKATHLNKVWTTSSPATVTPKPTKIMEERVEGYSTTTMLPPSAPSPAQAAPSMPPNLQRILQGGDIVERLGENGFALERKNVQLPSPLKTLGSHKVKVSLKRGVSAELEVYLQK